MATQAVVEKRSGPVRDDERSDILEAIRAGESLCSIAQRTGRGKSTIGRIAKAAGLTFDRTRTNAATAAKQADVQARLAAFADGLLGDMERLRLQLWEPCVVYSFGGKENTFNEAEISEPDFRAKQAIMTSLGIGTDKILAIRKAEAGPGEAAGLIVDLVTAIRGDK